MLHKLFNLIGGAGSCIQRWRKAHTRTRSTVGGRGGVTASAPLFAGRLCTYTIHLQPST